jgi:hypothetical protein
MTKSDRADGERSHPQQREDGRHYSPYAIKLDSVSKRRTPFDGNKSEVRTILRNALMDCAEVPGRNRRGDYLD